MSTIQKGGLLSLKDKNGNLYILYPVTTKENIADLEEATQSVSGLLSPNDKIKLDSLAINGIGSDDGGVYIMVDTSTATE